MLPYFLPECGIQFLYVLIVDNWLFHTEAVQFVLMGWLVRHIQALQKTAQPQSRVIIIFTLLGHIGILTVLWHLSWQRTTSVCSIMFVLGVTLRFQQSPPQKPCEKVFPCRPSPRCYNPHQSVQFKFVLPQSCVLDDWETIYKGQESLTVLHST